MTVMGDHEDYWTDRALRAEREAARLAAERDEARAQADGFYEEMTLSAIDRDRLTAELETCRRLLDRLTAERDQAVDLATEQDRVIADLMNGRP